MIKVDPKKCIMCGVCEVWAPEVFRQVDPIKVEVSQTSAKRYPNLVRSSIDICPTEAIYEEPT